ncbi:glycosyl transferase [Nitrosomonas supralitoralis]|uniref:Glycosyl transferase n=2 Tax=Nitrosomonas supralitoralis TaxID=2116706 RepID=A0A2P7NUH2_9PROT|nr:glycosyl transferase [Nitrosomonas supralitoralis]
MSTFMAPAIDVVIPVYNAPELSKRCIDSVVMHLGSSIRMIYIQDDASGSETRAMLEGLLYPQVNVYHAPNNQGYGRSVNDAIARSDADWVLVLNSDIEVLGNFLPLLCTAMAADPKLVVINPTEGDMLNAKANRYLCQSGGYVTTYRFRGYAFLIRRTVFQAMGGFDPQFGRGYYEDTDLGRRLTNQGWRMGVHPDAIIRHETGASFGRGKAYQELVKRNRALYLSRYPLARQNVLVVSGACTLDDLPLKLVNSLEQVMRQGGRLHWLTPTRLPVLSCLQMRNSEIDLRVLLELMLRGWSREDKRLTEVWLLPAAPAWVRALLKLFVLMRRLEVRAWEATSF